MENLTSEQKANIRRMSGDRLRLKLCRAGYDDEEVADTRRADLLAEYAAHLAKPPPKPAAVDAPGEKAAGLSDAEIELRRQELQLRERELENKGKRHRMKQNGSRETCCYER